MCGVCTGSYVSGVLVHKTSRVHNSILAPNASPPAAGNTTVGGALTHRTTATLAAAKLGVSSTGAALRRPSVSTSQRTAPGFTSLPGQPSAAVKKGSPVVTARVSAMVPVRQPNAGSAGSTAASTTTVTPNSASPLNATAVVAPTPAPTPAPAPATATAGAATSSPSAHAPTRPNVSLRAASNTARVKGAGASPPNQTALTAAAGVNAAAPAATALPAPLQLESMAFEPPVKVTEHHSAQATAATARLQPPPSSGSPASPSPSASPSVNHSSP
jgi:hypothetical protein